MKYELKALALLGDVPRPVVPFRIGNNPATFDGFVDTGASGCLFAEELAAIAGIDLDTAALDSTTRGIAGRTLPGRLATVTLQFASIAWTTNAWFFAGWVWEHQLLGMAGFLDQFELRLNATQGWCELT